jgi:hypothetical protein
MRHFDNQVKQATMTPTNTNHPSNQQSVQTVSTNIVNNSGTVNVSRYVDFSNSSQTDDDELSKLFDKIEHYENNHQLRQDTNTEKATEKETSNPPDNADKGNPQHSTTTEASSFKTGTGTPIIHNAYGTVIGPKRTFTIPYASEKRTTIVTPQTRKSNPTDSTTPHVTTTFTNQEYREYQKETAQQFFVKVLRTERSHGIYHSALLGQKYRPTHESLSLSPELEPLRSVILSQHESFTQHIKDLGHHSISLTKIIEKKKDSLLQLVKNKKIPRSLQIKCELTTSAAYIDDPDFLALKADLQHEISTFIQKGSKIMATWTEKNIEKLIYDRCSDILSIALQILNELVIFHSEILGSPCWYSVPKEHNTLFLLKLYLSNTLLDITEVISYLSLSPEEILLTGAKLLSKNSTEEEAQSLLDSLELSNIDYNDDFECTFIKETLLNFDQILIISTVTVWSTHEEKLKQALAASNMKARMKSLATIEATDATAAAINRATEKINIARNLNLNTNLRLTTLEKTLKRQEQRFNESVNNSKKRKTQKNSTGSHTTEPMASPDKMALQKKPTTVLDLTGDKPTEKSIQRKQDSSSHRNNLTKRQHQKNYTPEATTKKSIQWREGEVKNFNPNSPVAPTSQPLTHHAYTIPIGNPMNMPLFHLTHQAPTTHLQSTFTPPMYLPPPYGQYNQPVNFGQYNQLLQQHTLPQHYPPGQQVQTQSPFQPTPPRKNTSTRENPFGAHH